MHEPNTTFPTDYQNDYSDDAGTPGWRERLTDVLARDRPYECAHGHPWMPETTSYDRNPQTGAVHKRCLVCRREARDAKKLLGW